MKNNLQFPVNWNPFFKSCLFKPKDFSQRNIGHLLKEVLTRAKGSLGYCYKSFFTISEQSVGDQPQRLTGVTKTWSSFSVWVPSHRSDHQKLRPPFMSPLEDSWKQPDQEASRGTAAYSASHNGFILFSSQRHQSLLESDSTGEEVCELTTHRATIALLVGNKKQISLKRLILERVRLSFCSMLTNFLQC